jgi:hypothetical protein
MTPSTVSRDRIVGQPNALISGLGSARPEVVRDGAAKATVGQLDDVGVWTVL